MPLKVGSRARQLARKTRGRPKRHQPMEHAHDTHSDEPDESAIDATKILSPRRAPRKPKDRTISIMEEMLQAVKASEARCLAMAEAVDKKLNNFQHGHVELVRSGQHSGHKVTLAQETSSIGAEELETLPTSHEDEYEWNPTHKSGPAKKSLT